MGNGSRKVLVVGIPDSGKSTFIAALRHQLVTGEVPTTLAASGLSRDESHLNALEDRWLKCEQLERTKTSTEAWVQFQLIESHTGNQTELTIPDLRGESFEGVACRDRCSSELAEAAALADGYMLFTSANKADDMLLLSDFGDLITHEGEIAKKKPDKAPDFVPEAMPEEVKLVEFLQFVNRSRSARRRRTLAVLVSAWDLVVRATPADWLSTNRPMLSQFLDSRTELWLTRVYGVSAQGGELPRDQAKLKKIRKASERVRLQYGDLEGHDLTEPVNWLMKGAL